MITPVILAGGSGTRLWPLSRKLHPKQFMRLVGNQTLLQSTILRLTSLEGVQPPMVICNEAHRFLVAEQLREIDIDPQAIVLEPVGRNTAPALAVAALMSKTRHEDAMLLALPSDHHIADPEEFLRAVRQGAAFARQSRLVTFGIVPRAPETEYGYIRKGEPFISEGDHQGPEVWKIDQFVEKPDLEIAKAYLASGNYCWNSGIFIFKATCLLNELQRQSPEIVEHCEKALDQGVSDSVFYRLDKSAFEACPSDSIDYAVMEKTTSGVMVALDSGWNDLGSWEALWQAGAKDENRNVVYGDACLQDVKNTFVYASSRLVTAVGLDHHVVVETRDAVFVASRDHVRQTKALVDQLKSRERTQTVTHQNACRPRDGCEDIDRSEPF